MTDPIEAARILSVLVRSDEEGLTHFAARTHVATELPVEALRWWQGFLVELVEHLERSDRRLDALREALEHVPTADAPAPSQVDVSEPPSSAEPSERLSGPSISAPPSVAMPLPPGRGARSPWASPASPVRSGSAPEESRDETAAINVLQIEALGPAIPFREGAATPPASIEGDETVDVAGETSVIDPETIAAALSSYPLPAKLPMTVENYAALVARSEGASEAQLAELHRAYGVADPAHRKRIDQEFSEAFARDATLRLQFAEYLRQGRDWLRRQRGGT